MMQSEEHRLAGERAKMEKLRAARLAVTPETPKRHAVESDEAARTGNTDCQVERVLTIIRDHGPCTDMDIERLFSEKFPDGISTNSVHARRNDLMDQDLVGDTGRVAVNEKTGMKVTLWGLTADITYVQRRINRYSRTNYRHAFAYAFTIPVDSEAMEFLRAWNAEQWDVLDARWPKFIRDGV